MLPLTLTSTAKPCLIVGGGNVACRRASKLLAAGLSVTVESPVLSNRFVEIEPQIEYLEREYQHRNLAEYGLVFACTDNKELNRDIINDSKESGILANAADNPEISDFQMPLTLEMKPLIISINSGIPALSRKIARDIAQSLPEDIAEYSARLQQIRKELKESNTPKDKMLEFIEILLEPDNYQKVLKYNCKELLKTLKFE